MEKTKYSLFVTVTFLFSFSIMSCNCSANFASTFAWRVYEKTKQLVRAAHTTLGTAGSIVCAAAVTAFAGVVLYKHSRSRAHHQHALSVLPAAEKLGSLLPPPSVNSAIDKNFRGVRMRVVTGDITAQRVDIIVNAANDHLTGGGGVDGAIQQAAGPELADYCIKNFPVLAIVGGVPVRCPVGEVRVTPPFGLAHQGIKFLIHANGPRGSTPNRGQLLASCYRNAVTEANRLKAASIAFPAISVGIFGYPIDEAAECAVRTVTDAIEKAQPNTIREIRFVLYDKDPNYRELLRAYTSALAKYM